MQFYPGGVSAAVAFRTVYFPLWQQCFLCVPSFRLACSERQLWVWEGTQPEISSRSAAAHRGGWPDRRALLALATGLSIARESSAHDKGVASNSEVREVLVAGAAGRSGRAVVEALRARGVAVRAGVRNPLGAMALAELADPGVEVVPLDVSSSRASLITAAVNGVDAVVSCVGFRPIYVLARGGPPPRTGCG